MRRNHHLDAVLRELETAGIRPEVRQGGRHVHVRWRGRGGIQRLVVLSNSGDFARGRANARAIARRLLRQDGLI